MNAPRSEPWAPDWANVPDASVPYLLSEAKEHLRDIIAMGINSDQRSVALGGVFGGGAFALFTVSATVFSGMHQTNGVQDNALQWAPFASGFCFMIASALCLTAAIPSDFYVSGYEPRSLFPSTSNLIWMQMYTVEDIQRRIDENRLWLSHAAGRIKLAIYSGFTGLLAGTMIFAAGIASRIQASGSSGGATLAMSGVTVAIILLLVVLARDARRA